MICITNQYVSIFRYLMFFKASQFFLCSFKFSFVFLEDLC